MISYRTVERIVVPESWGNGGKKKRKNPGKEGRKKEAGRKEFGVLLFIFFLSFFLSIVLPLHPFFLSLPAVLEKGEDLI